jgi:hypothetical protein
MALTTLVIDPEFIVAAEESTHVVESDFRGGAHHAQVVGQRVRRWNLPLHHATNTERAAVRAKIDEMCGGTGVFNVTIPEEGLVAVRFDTDRLGLTRLSSIATALVIPLIEALNHDG